MTKFIFFFIFLMPSIGVAASYPMPNPFTANQTMVSDGTKWTSANAAPVCTAETITNDTTTNSTMYPVWVTANTGNLPAKVTSTKLTFNPSTGALSATTFLGAFSGNATTATALAANGTNCSAGQYGLGVDASGNSESCGAITALGTIATGVWNGTAVSTTYGGLGIDSHASTGFYYDTAGTASVKTATQSTALLDVVVGDSGSGGTKGLVPAAASGDAAAGKFLKADGSFAIPPGSGGGSGINYTSPNGDAEVNATTGWANFADAAAATPVNLTGGSPTTVISVSSSVPLRGSYSYKWIKSANNRQGEGTSFDFTINAADAGKMINVSFDYLLSGTYVDNDLGVWCYDVTNSNLIQPAPYNILNTGVPATWSGVFQAASNSTSYRCGFYTQSVSASAYTLQWDNFQVGPQIKSIGPPVTDVGATAWTPTGAMTTNTTYTGKWRRDGDMMEGWVLASFAGAPNSTAFYLNLPSGYSIDTAKINLTTADRAQLGEAVILDVSTRWQSLAHVGYESTTTLAVFGASTSQAGETQVVTQAFPMTIANGDQIQIHFKVPILGWGSGVQMSDSADTRVVAMIAQQSSPTVTTINGSWTANSVVKYSSGAQTDTHGGYSASTGLYTVKVPGIYRVSASNQINATYAVGNLASLGVAKNGTVLFNSYQASGGVQSYLNAFVVGTVSVVAGDTIGVSALSDATTPTLGTSGTTNYLMIERLSGPTQIAASESAVSHAYLAANQTGVNPNATFVKINFDTKEFDSHGGFDTTNHKYVAQTPGTYSVDANIIIAAANVLANNYILALYKNGAVVSYVYTTPPAASVFGMVSARQIKLLAGDYIEIYFYGAGNNSASTLTAIGGSTGSYVSIARTGNY